MVTNSSRDWPKVEPISLATPTTSNGRPLILISRPTTSRRPKSFSATATPTMVTGRRRSSSPSLT